MKKVLAAVLIILLVAGVAFAANNQKIYSVDTELYRTISQIYILTGHAQPSATGPWSGDELLKMYEAIDRNDVPSFMLAKYDAAMKELGASPKIEFKGGATEFSGTLDLELYVHTYSPKADDAYKQTDVSGLTEHAFEGRSWWFGKDLNHITPFFKLSWETWLTDHFYTAFDFGLQNAFRGNEGNELGSSRLNSNIPMLQTLQFNLKVMDIASFPHRAFAAIGGDGWSFEAGRDRLSWGVGTTGNVVLSDNFPYHDMVRLTAYGEKFKYTYLVSFFPAKQNYYNKEGKSYNGTGFNNSTQTLDGLWFYSAHRFEGRFFNDKLGFTLTEGLVYMSETNSLQFAALSPMYFMHNAFMSNNSNSTLALELDWATPLKGLNVYGQLLLDQFTMPGFEDPVGPGKSYSSSPNGIAVLGGAKFMTKMQEGVLTINPEFAYVTSFCYLRDGVNDFYGMDYTGAIRSRLYAYEDRGLGTDVLYEDYVIGYKYGPDCLVANLSGSWEGEKLSFNAKGLFIMHGTHDLWTKWKKVPANCSEETYKQYSGPSPSHSETTNYRYPDAQTVRNAIWYTLDVGVGAKYKIIDNLELSFNMDIITMRNVFNVGTQDDATDIQFIIGAKYECF
ncbi:MAG: hypothetical protein IJR16_03970 [Spirochaetales bacterium]|nr:hypothetical protein [Spirochaetales bacterium]